MSLPESEKELLLSASIDGVLSPEEQEVLDRWFREDPTAVKRRDEMASLVTSVRDAYRPLRQGRASSKPLGRDFADAIVDRAVAEAMAEDLASSHPLVKIGRDRQFSTQPAATSTVPWSRYAAIAAMAASILGGVFVATRGGKQDDLGDSLAQSGSQTTIEQPAEVEQPSTELLSPEPQTSRPAEMIAAAPIPTAESVESVSIAETPAGNAGLPSEPIASVTPPKQSPAMSPTDVASVGQATKPSADDSFRLAAVMVVSVELTEKGRQSLALLSALRAADIRIGNNGIVSDQVVSDLRKSAVVKTPPNNQSANLYFVEAPARQIDRFLMQVMADKDSFASIGLGIADNPPLLASIGRWRPGDAEKDASNNPIGQQLASDAKAKSVARDLVSADGKPLSIGRGTAVIPMDRSMGPDAFMMALPAAASDPRTAKDFSAQFILLVH